MLQILGKSFREDNGVKKAQKTSVFFVHKLFGKTLINNYSFYFTSKTYEKNILFNTLVHLVLRITVETMELKYDEESYVISG